ncbi:MAG: Gfo/Idh/MocA family oxidoreductase [Clostridia bacterium]|nr:Gfo/Idh/MocA family oxidoreductase [Clostridia bacterium]
MDKFRWAYVGCGSIANNTARSITRGDHAIAAVYSRNLEKARDFAERYGGKAFDNFGSLLENGGFDGVYIATPHSSHADYAVRAMDAGFPVLCEKPVGVSVPEVDRMLTAARENDVYFCEAMWTWFSDVALTVGKWINGKRIGEIRNVRMEYAFPGVMASRNSRLLTPETAGGALLDIGVYPITYCYRLFGYPDSIVCKGRLKNGIDIAEIIRLGYKGFECRLDISLTRLGESCRITGTDGKISVPVFHMAQLVSLRTKMNRENYTGRTDYLTEFTRAAEEIRAGRKESAFVPHSATRNCMKIMDECRKQLGLVYPFEKGQSVPSSKFQVPRF